MVKVLARAVRTRQRPLRRDVEVPFGAGVLRLRAKHHRGDRGPGPPPARDPQRAPPLRRGPRAARPGRRLPGPAHRRGRPTTLDDDGPSAEEQADLARRLRRVPAGGRGPRPHVAAPLPHELLHDLLGARPLLAAAGQGILSPEAIQRLYRPRSRSPRRGAVDGGRRRPHRRGPHHSRAPAGGARPNRARAGRPRRGAPRRAGSGPRAGGLARARLRARARGPRTTSAPSATSWSTRCRTSRPCSCACWPAARCRVR
jgi:hypothetical protein